MTKSNDSGFVEACAIVAFLTGLITLISGIVAIVLLRDNKKKNENTALNVTKIVGIICAVATVLAVFFGAMSNDPY